MAQPTRSSRGRGVQTKRANGKGSIHPRKDGRWGYGLTINGKRIQRCARTRQDAERGLTELVRLAEQHALMLTDRQTLGQYLAHWLQDSCQHRVRHQTYRIYRVRLRHVTERIGHVQLSALTPMHLRRCYSQLLSEGYAGATVNHIHRALKTALRQAVRDDLLRKSPADAVDPPRVDTPEARVMEMRDVYRLLDATDGTRWYALWALLGTCGLRIGEALALRWDQLDPERGVIQLRETIVQLDGGGCSTGALKSEASRRDVILTRRARTALQKHKAILLREQLEAQRWEGNNLVFPNREGKLMHPSVAQYALKRALKKLGLPEVSPHALRHTAATRLIEDGEDVRAVQEMLGHANVRTTLAIYHHVSERMRQRVADRMDALLDAAGAEK